jgi:hypothetical protein
MLKAIALALFGLAIASAAQGMPFASVHQPDSTLTQIRMGCGAGRVMIDGQCESRAANRQERRANRRCARYTGGQCVQ